jgi:hypothetical protein
MNLEKKFKNIIKIEVLYLIFVIIYTSLFMEIAYVDPNAPLIWTVQDALGILSLIFMLVYAVNLYFLYKFKSIGKTLYVPLIIISFILGILLTPAEALSTLPTSYYLVEWVSGLISGIVIAFLYFTEIKDKFNSE